LNWIEENLISFQESGFWTDLHERIFLDLPIYLAGEHSAQQSTNKLSELEKSFEEGKLNILSCSTTMEMGVDIGGISAVVMNNVPPKPANYLQRAGRAGRRKESKALALTFCSNNPIGNAVINNPKWAMITEIASPKMNLSSVTIVQRHINAFFLGSFIRNIGGINIKETIEHFLKGNKQNLYLNLMGLNRNNL
jgi:Lhr-like helicase